MKRPGGKRQTALQPSRMLVVACSLLTSAALVSPVRKPHSASPFGDPLGLQQSRPAIATSATADRATASAALGLAAVLASQPDAAWAKGGEYGVFEGRIVSLAHPTVMALVYAASAWSAFTGLQWRRLREVGSEITSLKAELKAHTAKISSAEENGETPSSALLSETKALQAKVDELTSTRKELADGSFRDKHYQVRRETRYPHPPCPFCL